MKKNLLSMLKHLLVCWVVSFVFIYLLVFVGGWRLVETGNMIAIEIAVAILVGFIVWFVFEITKAYEKKILELESRIQALENALHEKFDD